MKNDDGTVRYTCGQLLFDPKRPTEIMAQMNYPWLEPTTYEDQHGLVSNVTFVEGLVLLQATPGSPTTARATPRSASRPTRSATRYGCL